MTAVRKRKKARLREMRQTDETLEGVSWLFLFIKARATNFLSFCAQVAIRVHWQESSYLVQHVFHETLRSVFVFIGRHSGRDMR